jgi:hypothetical protein
MDDVQAAPPGHSAAAHRAHGWCAFCPGRTVMDEVGAWRSQESDAEAGPLQSTTEVRACPACGEDALFVATITLLTGEGPRRAGGWSLCMECEATPEEARHG